MYWLEGEHWSVFAPSGSAHPMLPLTSLLCYPSCPACQFLVIRACLDPNFSFRGYACNGAGPGKICMVGWCRGDISVEAR